jgi:hypothetical protein
MLIRDRLCEKQTFVLGIFLLHRSYVPSSSLKYKNSDTDTENGTK